MEQLYAIVDTARRRELYNLVSAAPERRCLFAGKLDPVLERNAPYLVRIDPDLALWSAWREYGWGDNWGILCRSDALFDALWRHFRRFLQAKLPNGEVVLFRFYDPRVWRTYLQSGQTDEMLQWFNKVNEYLVENNEGHLTLRYWLNARQLTISQIGKPGRLSPSQQTL